MARARHRRGLAPARREGDQHYGTRTPKTKMKSTSWRHRSDTAPWTSATARWRRRQRKEKKGRRKKKRTPNGVRGGVTAAAFSPVKGAKQSEDKMRRATREGRERGDVAGGGEKWAERRTCPLVQGECTEWKHGGEPPPGPKKKKSGSYRGRKEQTHTQNKREC